MNQQTKKANGKTLSSRVCKIANKIPHTISRKKAFLTAWKTVKNECIEIKETIKQKTEFDKYVDMIRSRAHYYSKCYKRDYADVEAQGFLIYCISLQNYQKSKASFSTFLFTNLSGRLRDYCRQKKAREKLDNFDKSFDTFIDLWEVRESPPQEQFLQYAKCYLSPFTFTVLEWLLKNQLEGFKSKTNPALISIAKRLSVRVEKLEIAWKELTDFWNLRGSVFYASN
jgi:hypothetical protein